MQPLLQWKSTKYYIFWVCVCNLSYPASNAHAPYCHLWPARLYKIFPHNLIKSRFSKKKMLWDIKNVWFGFLVHVSSEKCRIVRRLERGMILKNLYWSSCKVSAVSLSDFNETRIFSAYFLKILKYQISWKLIQWEPSCSTWTNGNTDWTDIFFKVRTGPRAYAPDAPQPVGLLCYPCTILVF
jgi:hypothetical protein